MGIKDAGKPLPSEPQKVKERSAKSLYGNVPGVAEGYTKHRCEAPRGHPGFMNGGRPQSNKRVK